MQDRLVLHSVRAGVLLTLLTSTASHAQGPGRLFGTVRDSIGRPVREAQVSIAALSRITRTDTAGRFSMNDLPRGNVELSVRHLGYGIGKATITITNAAIDSIAITLTEQTVELAAIEVSARKHPFMVDFEQRRARGIGVFVTREQIDARNTSTPSDLFRTMPSVRLVRVGSGYGVRFPSSLGMSTTTRGGRSATPCVPMIWLDGQKAPGLEIDDLRSNDLEAIEVYRGASTLPAQFATGGAAQCGAVVIWTRRRM